MGDTEIIIEPGRQDIVFKREFDGADGLEICRLSCTDRPGTDPELVVFRKYETIVDEMEPRAGGRWRYINRNADSGEEFGFHGVYHEVMSTGLFRRPSSRPFRDLSGLRQRRSSRRDGRTLMTAVSLAPSVEARDGIVASGMESGARETYDRLDEVVQGLLALGPSYAAELACLLPRPARRTASRTCPCQFHRDRERRPTPIRRRHRRHR